MRYMKRLLAYARPYWGYLAASFLGLLGMTALSLVTPGLVGDLINQLSGETDIMGSLYLYAAALLVAYILRGVCRFMQNYLGHVAAWRLLPDLRVLMYENLQRLSLRYYHDKQTGELMSRLVNDTDKIETLIAHAGPELITSFLTLAGVAGILMTINPQLTLYTFIPIPFIVAGGIFFAKKIRPLFRNAQQSLAELNAILQDNLTGIKEIQVFNQQRVEKERVRKRASKYSELIISALRKSSIFHPLVEFFTSLGTIIVVLFGGMLVMDKRMAVGDITSFILYLNLFYQPIATLSRLLEDVQAAGAGAARMFEVLDAESEVRESDCAVTLPEGVPGEIAFEHVSFGYVQDAPVLDDISFTVGNGEMVAIVGPTGVGKTTVISLLARFYDPLLGCIRLGGYDLRDVTLSSLRSKVSIVLQDVFLFNGTVAENIAYGLRDATRGDIIKAAETAYAHNFIMEMPNGYDTEIGERGMRLSGGQKQRLAIARAVLRDTPVLVMDEATASVDVETESEIQRAIQALQGSRTIIIIAHRLSTVKRADKIIVMENGRIVERGNHEALLREGGVYARLCDVQLSATQEMAANLLREQ